MWGEGMGVICRQYLEQMMESHTTRVYSGLDSVSRCHFRRWHQCPGAGRVGCMTSVGADRGTLSCMTHIRRAALHLPVHPHTARTSLAEGETLYLNSFRNKGGVQLIPCSENITIFWLYSTRDLYIHFSNSE